MFMKVINHAAWYDDELMLMWFEPVCWLRSYDEANQTSSTNIYQETNTYWGGHLSTTPEAMKPMAGVQISMPRADGWRQEDYVTSRARWRQELLCRARKGPPGSSKLGRCVQARQGGSSSLILKPQPWRTETPWRRDWGAWRWQRRLSNGRWLHWAMSTELQYWAVWGLLSGGERMQDQGGWIWMGGGGEDGAGGGVETNQGTAAVPAWTAGSEAASVGEAGSGLQGPCISLLGCITMAGKGSGQWPGWWAGD